jgi:mannosyltransferase
MGSPSARADRAAAASAPVAALLLVLVVAATLRFGGLDAQSLWNDELSSWQQSHQESLADVIEHGVRPTPYPPAFQVLLYGVEETLGSSETALRLPSAIAGTLAVLVMFFTGRRLWGDREGLIAAALLAVSYQAVYYSQEARAYSLLLLCSLVSAHFWFGLVRALEAERRPDPGTAAGYFAGAVAAMYLHYFGLLLVGMQLAVLCALFAARPRQLVFCVCLALAVALAWVPWLPYFLEEFSQGHSYLTAPGMHELRGYWRFLFFDRSELVRVVVASIFAAAALRWLWQRRDAPARRPWRAWLTSPTALLLAWLVLPVAAAYVRSLTATPIFTFRNLIISLPAAYLLLSRAITALFSDGRLQAVVAGGLVGALLYGPFLTGDYYHYPRKEQFREAAAVVAEREAEFPNARVVAHAWNESRFDYYLARNGAKARVDLLAGTEDDLVRTRGFIAAERPEYLWLLVGHRRVDPAFMELLDEELELVFHVPLYGAFTRLYRRTAP